MLERIGLVAAEVASRLQEARLLTSHFAPEVGPSLVEIEELAPRITANAVRRYIENAVQQARAVAEDSVILHAWVP